VKGPMKWALLGATVLSILLSWGHNFMPFTDFFLDYVPMYSKFRTVASILVIAEFTIPLLAMLALKRLVDEPDLMGKQMRWVYVSFALTGGIALLFALMPTVFFSDFISAAELEALKGIPADYLAPLESNLRSIREGIFVADCWRSFWIIVIGMALLLLYRYRKLKAEYMVGAMVLLCLIDMWQVNKRYLNDGMFVEKSVREQAQPMTETDRLILRDKDLDYRVLNLASNTFNENETSYYHKSIGGYHAAKLRRYQDLIDNYIAPEMQQLMSALAKAGGDMTKVKGDSIFPVLNMLNAKYFIVPLQDNKTVPIQNPYVLGNAWFVDKLNYVNNANQEFEALGKLNLRHEAVADARFKTVLGEATPQDSTSVVKLTAYAPNQLTYEVKSVTGGVMVFSEIYYPEWTATVDGKPVEIGRADYVLRALKVDKGQHQVVLTFDPKSVKQTETVAYAAYVVLLLVVLFGLYAEWKRKQKV
jgi:membrane protein